MAVRIPPALGPAGGLTLPQAPHLTHMASPSLCVLGVTSEMPVLWVLCVTKCPLVSSRESRRRPGAASWCCVCLCAYRCVCMRVYPGQVCVYVPVCIHVSVYMGVCVCTCAPVHICTRASVCVRLRGSPGVAWGRDQAGAVVPQLLRCPHMLCDELGSF